MRAVVLMYHRLGAAGAPEHEPGEHIYTVPAAAFEEHLETIAAEAVPVLPFEALVQPAGGAARCGRAVALTFDDGYDSDHTYALPPLLRRGWTAAFFVTPAWIGAPGHLGWPEVRELARCGMTVGAHGWDHRPLSSLGAEELRSQLREARWLLEDRLGRAPVCLSLPGGAGSAAVERAAREEGFTAIAGSVPRSWKVGAAPSLIPRFAVRAGDGRRAVRDLVGQRPAALARAWLRYRAAGTLRTVIGEPLYQRLRQAASVRAVAP